MKKIFLSILISFIGLVGFGYCGIFYTVNNVNSTNVQVNGYANLNLDPYYCYNASNFTSFYVYSGTVDTNNIIIDGVNNSYNSYITFCVNTSNYIFRNQTSSKGTLRKIAYDIDNFGSSCDCPTCPTCEEQYTSEECQQEYSLMPISSCDSEFCQLNGLCGTGSSGSGDLQWSSLFINGIQHVGGSIIDVTIPSEIQRNYIYTGENEETFELNVEGLNGDPDYIQGIIDVNSYRPTSEDFTNTFVGGLTLIFPYIIITAIVLFIWRFIRKIFK